MKPFNRKAALAGDIVITRSGRKVTQLHEFKCKEGNKLIGVIEGALLAWEKDGLFFLNGKKSSDDLFMEGQ